ncbi:aldolase [Silvibacterium acidisoli]|uniref:aldolase n=1 Tax=Acidobacteriaceae bacterium ZG23-2 TaxID=2883246 RepID=UPI00406CB062
MLSLEQIEAACAAGKMPVVCRHELEVPELTFSRIYYPFGFPMEVRSNSNEVLEHFTAMWGKFRPHFEADMLRTEVVLVDDGSTDCPPEPSHQIFGSWLICVADSRNSVVADLQNGITRITVSRGALRHPLYVQYFLLGLASSCISTCLATPIHAGCVAFNGRGFLLCGDSGAGKSTLSYACARAGWNYVSDDASYMLSHGDRRMVSGNPHQVRFRPSAAELFPELLGLAVTPRAAGKPSIELPTAGMPYIKTADTACIDFMVFLKRRDNGFAEIEPYSADAARLFMRQVLFGPEPTLTAQHAAIERMLGARLVALHYSDLRLAIARLEELSMQ